MIGRRRPQLLEVRTALGDCAYEGGVIARAERVELGRGDLELRVRPERRNHAALPARFADRAMVLQPVGRRVGRRQHLDVEALEQRARPELRALELLDHFVVNLRSSLTGKRVAYTEHRI